MKYILKGYIHSYLSLCKVQISLHDSTTFLLALHTLYKLNSDSLKTFCSPKDYRLSSKTKRSTLQLRQDEFNRAVSSVRIGLPVLGLRPDQYIVLLCFNFCLESMDFFLLANTAILAQALIWRELSTSSS